MTYWRPARGECGLGSTTQMTFSELGLRPELVRAVTDAGYTIPTPIQARAVPVALDGKDLIACAQTGTGKTAAFLLPILQHLAAGRRGRHPRALIVTPTRELAAQIGEMATVYGAHLHLRSTVIFGGVGMEPQTRRATQRARSAHRHPGPATGPPGARTGAPGAGRGRGAR